MASSILWYDLETFGIDPRHDRIAQFACIRTNMELKPLSAGLVLYNRISDDYLPSPAACMVHGISPAQTRREGISEYELTKAIRSELMMSGTCTAGFNSIRFDDEFIRNLFYRNLFDPYEREWMNGNSRWDVIDLFRAARDLRPEGMEWPVDEQGKPVFKLGRLAEANGIPLLNAHDALHDINATILLTGKLRAAQPRLYEYYWKHRSKDALRPLINLNRPEILLHTSAYYTSTKGCTAPVLPVSSIPGKRNSIIAVDLRYDPEPLFSMSVEELRKRLFTGQDLSPDMGPLFASVAGIKIPLMELTLNRCPFLAPLAALDAAAEARLHINLPQCRERAARIQAEPDLIQKLAGVFDSSSLAAPPVVDADYAIYSGGFFADTDRGNMETLHEAIASLGPQLAYASIRSLQCADKRLPVLMRRLFARNWPDLLSAKERKLWRSFCASRILHPPRETACDYALFSKQVATLQSSVDTSPEERLLLQELQDWKHYIDTNVLSYTPPGLAAKPTALATEQPQARKNPCK
ncbi:MAG: exodeoxyribonuclease I [Spirochaetes bacterium]|nr:exodeoxyribonuclease I [Spirochaetota bacterium]MBU0954914.1 exodeoxyribonuclease I [Spirochaetota bacterium]